MVKAKKYTLGENRYRLMYFFRFYRFLAAIIYLEKSLLATFNSNIRQDIEEIAKNS